MGRAAFVRGAAHPNPQEVANPTQEEDKPHD